MKDGALVFGARFTFAVIVVLSAGMSVVVAHHGWAGFDRTKKVEISGIITPLEAKLSAMFSLMIWSGVISCGRLIAFF